MCSHRPNSPGFPSRSITLRYHGHHKTRFRKLAKHPKRYGWMDHKRWVVSGIKKIYTYIYCKYWYNKWVIIGYKYTTYILLGGNWEVLYIGIYKNGFYHKWYTKSCIYLCVKLYIYTIQDNRPFASLSHHFSGAMLLLPSGIISID